MKKIYGLCVVSLIISISSLCVSYVRCDPFNIGSFESIIAALSVLVTVLIGWQIFNYIFIKQEMEKRMSEVTKEAFSDFFHVLNGYTDAQNAKMLETCEDEEVLDCYFKSLNEVKKSREANMSHFAVSFILEKMIDATKAMTIRKRNGILVGRKDYYLTVLSYFEHDSIPEIVHYINTAEEVPDKNEWHRREEKAREEEESSQKG